jgi:hypothetical protein
VPYAPEEIWHWDTAQAAEWLHVLPDGNDRWELFQHPKHGLKFGLSPSKQWLAEVQPLWLAELARAKESEQRKQAELQAQTGSPDNSSFESAAAASTESTPSFLSSSNSSQSEALMLNAPTLRMRIPAVQRMVLIFFLRSWSDMGDAHAWLSCEDEKSGVAYGETSEPVLLRGTWTVQATQAAAALLWPPNHAFQHQQQQPPQPQYSNARSESARDSDQSDEAADSDQIQQVELVPPCPFNTLHVRLLKPAPFLVIGNAES